SGQLRDERQQRERSGRSDAPTPGVLHRSMILRRPAVTCAGFPRGASLRAQAPPRACRAGEGEGMSEDSAGQVREPPVSAVESVDGVVVVRLAGELDLYNASEVRDALATAA